MGYINVAHNDFALIDSNTLCWPLMSVYTTTMIRLTADYKQDKAERAACNCLTAHVSSRCFR